MKTMTKYAVHLENCCTIAGRYDPQADNYDEHLTRAPAKVTCGLCLKRVRQFRLRRRPDNRDEHLVTEVEGTVTKPTSELDAEVAYRCPYCGQPGSCCMKRADIEAGHTERRFGCECHRGEFLVTVRGGSAG